MPRPPVQSGGLKNPAVSNLPKFNFNNADVNAVTLIPYEFGLAFSTYNPAYADMMAYIDLPANFYTITRANAQKIDRLFNNQKLAIKGDSVTRAMVQGEISKITGNDQVLLAQQLVDNPEPLGDIFKIAPYWNDGSGSGWTVNAGRYVLGYVWDANKIIISQLEEYYNTLQSIYDNAVFINQVQTQQQIEAEVEEATNEELRAELLNNYIETGNANILFMENEQIKLQSSLATAQNNLEVFSLALTDWEKAAQLNPAYIATLEKLKSDYSKVQQRIAFFTELNDLYGTAILATQAALAAANIDSGLPAVPSLPAPPAQPPAPPIAPSIVPSYDYVSQYQETGVFTPQVRTGQFIPAGETVPVDSVTVSEPLPARERMGIVEGGVLALTIFSILNM